MEQMINPSAAAGGAVADDVIKDVTMETFQQDVLEASMTTPVIVDFWATWCGTCEVEMPSMEKLYQKYKDFGFDPWNKIIRLSFHSNDSQIAIFSEPRIPNDSKSKQPRFPRRTVRGEWI